ncbi:MAG: hypothetical protein C0582_02435 [Alphaproteobacteria bacterium]|nr:MAG: hypothetical protein C0582_02435 [Alphaproteobacteria bacterium]
MSTYFIKNSIVQGSAKVKDYIKAVAAHDVGSLSVTNNPLPNRTGNRMQGKKPDFGPMYWQGQLGKDTVTSLNALGLGTNLGTIEIIKVQSDGHNNVEEIKYTLGKLNGATYAINWSLYYDANSSSKSGNGIIYTLEVVTNGIEIESNAVDQDQQAKGKVSAGLSRLNRQAVQS